MTLQRARNIALIVLLAATLVAFTPLAEGDDGTWQNTVGNIVWSAMFVAFPATIVLGLAGWMRGRRSTPVR